jgi:hypothetical protein
MNLWVALAPVAAVLAVVLLGYVTPARVRVLVDTISQTARTKAQLFWGVGPIFTFETRPSSDAGHFLADFHDVTRAANALMTPGIADETVRAVQRIIALNPKIAHVSLIYSLGDSSKDLVVRTAVQAALAVAPERVRSSFELSKREQPGADFAAKFEFFASPMRMLSIYGKFRNARAVREFRKRLSRDLKPSRSRKRPRTS